MQDRAGGNACCRHLLAGNKGFECGEADARAKAALDARVAQRARWAGRSRRNA